MQPRAQTPSTGLRHPSFKEEGAGKRCSECAQGHAEWSCNLLITNRTAPVEQRRQARKTRSSDPLAPYAATIPCPCTQPKNLPCAKWPLRPPAYSQIKPPPSTPKWPPRPPSYSQIKPPPLNPKMASSSTCVLTVEAIFAMDELRRVRLVVARFVTT